MPPKETEVTLTPEEQAEIDYQNYLVPARAWRFGLTDLLGPVLSPAYGYSPFSGYYGESEGSQIARDLSIYDTDPNSPTHGNVVDSYWNYLGIPAVSPIDPEFEPNLWDPGVIYENHMLAQAAASPNTQVNVWGEGLGSTEGGGLRAGQSVGASGAPTPFQGLAPGPAGDLGDLMSLIGGAGSLPQFSQSILSPDRFGGSSIPGMFSPFPSLGDSLGYPGYGTPGQGATDWSGQIGSLEEQLESLISQVGGITQYDPTELEQQLAALGTQVGGITQYDPTELVEQINAYQNNAAFLDRLGFDPSGIPGMQTDLAALQSQVGGMTPFDPSGLQSQIDAFTPFDPSGLQQQISAITPFDPSGIQSQLAALQTEFGGITPFDPSGLQSQIDAFTPYDPSSLQSQLAALQSQVGGIAPFDPSALQAQIDAFTPFDPSGIQSQITAYQDNAAFLDRLGFNPSEIPGMQSELANLQSAVGGITPFDPSELQQQIDAFTPFDPSNLQSQIDAFTPFDPSNLQSQIDAFTPYDPSGLQSQLAAIQSQVGGIVPFDPSGLQSQIDAFTPFDPSGIQSQINEYQSNAEFLDRLGFSPSEIPGMQSELANLQSAVSGITPFDPSGIQGELEALQGQLGGITPFDPSGLQSQISGLQTGLSGITQFDPSDLESQLASLQTQVGGMAPFDPSSLVTQLNALQSQVGGITPFDPSTLEGQLSDLQSHVGGIMPFDPSDLQSQIAGLQIGLGEIAPLQSQLESLQSQVGGITHFDPSNLQSQIAALQTGLGDIIPFDPSGIESELTALQSQVGGMTPFDPSGIESELASLQSQVGGTEPFDPSGLQAQISQLASSVGGMTPFDPSGLQSQLTSLQTGLGNIVPFDPSNLQSQIDAFTPFDPSSLQSQLESLQTNVGGMTPFDPSGLQSQLTSLQTGLGNIVPFDPANLQSQIDAFTPFDPSHLQSQINAFTPFDPSSLQSQIDAFTPFDPANLQSQIDAFTPFDPSHLQSQIDAYYPFASNLQSQIASLQTGLGNITPFDPANLQSQIDAFTPFDPAHLQSQINAFSPFDPSGLQSQIGNLGINLGGLESQIGNFDFTPDLQTAGVGYVTPRELLQALSDPHAFTGDQFAGGFLGASDFGVARGISSKQDFLSNLMSDEGFAEKLDLAARLGIDPGDLGGFGGYVDDLETSLGNLQSQVNAFTPFDPSVIETELGLFGTQTGEARTDINSLLNFFGGRDFFLGGPAFADWQVGVQDLVQQTLDDWIAGVDPGQWGGGGFQVPERRFTDDQAKELVTDLMDWGGEAAQSVAAMENLESFTPEEMENINNLMQTSYQSEGFIPRKGYDAYYPVRAGEEFATEMKGTVWAPDPSLLAMGNVGGSVGLGNIPQEGWHAGDYVETEVGSITPPGYPSSGGLFGGGGWGFSSPGDTLANDLELRPYNYGAPGRDIALSLNPETGMYQTPFGLQVGAGPTGSLDWATMGNEESNLLRGFSPDPEYTNPAWDKLGSYPGQWPAENSAMIPLAAILGSGSTLDKNPDVDIEDYSYSPNMGPWYDESNPLYSETQRPYAGTLGYNIPEAWEAYVPGWDKFQVGVENIGGGWSPTMMAPIPGTLPWLAAMEDAGAYREAFGDIAYDAATGEGIFGTGYAGGGLIGGGSGTSSTGLSDNIPGFIGGGIPEPVRLSEGEFVVPADVVSGLGDGSTEAGSRRLYEMIDELRSFRNKGGRSKVSPSIIPRHV